MAFYNCVLLVAVRKLRHEAIEGETDIGEMEWFVTASK
jgi:hypothetical protein